MATKNKTPKWHITVSVVQLSFVLCLVMLFSGLIGFWALPLGILAPGIGIVLMAFSAWAFRSSGERLYGVLIIFWAFFPLMDLRFRMPRSEGTAVITWNVSGPRGEEFDCAMEAMKEWTERHPDGIIFLQEMRRKEAKKLEEALQLNCIWKPYLSSCEQEVCNGLQMCAPDEWSFSRTGHRDFKQQGTYGFLQSELNHDASGQTVNALNIHLESLWRTGHNLPNENPITVLNHNATNQTEQVQQLLRIFNQLKDPILLIGDFNSPSGMWHHVALRKQLQDAHKNTGLGWGWTRFKSGLPVRIDYLYSSKTLKWTSPTRVRYDIVCSDHYPVESGFKMPTSD